MEILLEDYKRRLKIVNKFISKQRSNGSIVHQRREERLNTKAAEYRTFIVEIERAMARTLNENSGLNIPVVINSRLSELEEENRLLKLIIENGLGSEDLENEC